MQYFAFVIGGVVSGSPVAIPDDLQITDCFPADIATTMIPCVVDTVEGSTWADGVFTAPPTALSKAQLHAYANAKVRGLRAVARPYDLGSGVSVLADALTDTVALVSGLADWGTAEPDATQQWSDDFGTATTITGAQAVTLKQGGLAYLQSVFAVRADAATSIGADTITTTAEIDALAWPT